MNSHLTPAVEDRARIGLDDATENLYQRALAGAVLTYEAVDLTLLQIELRIREGDNATERLPHCASRQDRRLLEHRSAGWQASACHPAHVAGHHFIHATLRSDRLGVPRTCLGRWCRYWLGPERNIARRRQFLVVTGDVTTAQHLPRRER